MPENQLRVSKSPGHPTSAPTRSPCGSLPTARLLVSARRGVAVCRDAQRVVAVGQRSRERSPQMQVANDVTSANKLPSREARPGRRVNNSAAAEGGELREDCVEGALERGLADQERGVRGV